MRDYGPRAVAGPRSAAARGAVRYMAERLVLSIDGMGGDNAARSAPETVLQAIEIASRRRPELRFLVHGDEKLLNEALNAHPAARGVCEIRPASTAIGMDVKPMQAARLKDTSIGNAIDTVKSGEAAAVVSAGNTGAYMAIAMVRLRMMEGVHRPALSARWPAASGGYVVLLDVGANVTADAEQLVEFAIMGEAFQRAVSGIERPSVAFMNVGSEDQKGHEEIRAAARLVRESGVEINFKGFVEGDDIAKGTVDVIVTDGFTGNIALKTGEGTARLVSQLLREALTGGILATIGAAIAYPALKKLRARMDPGAFNGAVFLGLNGLVVKSHGSADGPGFASAIDVAARMAESHYRDEIARNIARLAAAQAAPAPAVARDAS